MRPHEDSEVCCGAHEVCEKDLIIKAAQNPVEYYDDEELDVFIGRTSDDYTEEETALFLHVLHTMWESDVPGWTRSLQLRGIEMPLSVRDEVLFIMGS
ncbi:hypothetical protein M2138_001450 [Dysgonomonadaceae bacterium PH5-43]|nr:hypothetical protein [Dysgonomonadaceae bacterium PH5-43]